MNFLLLHALSYIECTLLCFWEVISYLGLFPDIVMHLPTLLILIRVAWLLFLSSFTYAWNARFPAPPIR